MRCLNAAQCNMYLSNCEIIKLYKSDIAMGYLQSTHRVPCSECGSRNSKSSFICCCWMEWNWMQWAMANKKHQVRNIWWLGWIFFSHGGEGIRRLNMGFTKHTTLCQVHFVSELRVMDFLRFSGKDAQTAFGSDSRGNIWGIPYQIGKKNLDKSDIYSFLIYCSSQILSNTYIFF